RTLGFSLTQEKQRHGQPHRTNNDHNWYKHSVPPSPHGIDANEYTDFILLTAVSASFAIGGGSPPLDT
ncbi:MAG: hypothetical protein WCF40_08915, partial [Desulfobacterales bacterium]